MTTFVFIALCGLQPPVETQPPAVPPAPKVDRRIPPPIPRPPAKSRPINPGPAPAPEPRPDPAPLEEAPPPEVATASNPAPQALEKTVQHVFMRQHDVNVDGRLEPAELERRFGRNFVAADLNRDGFLDGYEVLHDRHNIGRAARRMEGLDLNREGQLVFKSDKPPVPIANIARGVIDMLDPDRDGFIQGRDVGDVVKREVVPRIAARIGVDAAPTPSALPTRPTTTQPAPTPPDPSLSPPLPQWTPPATKEPKAGQGAVPPKKQDELPSAEATILHLDKDGGGQLNETEVVDQLAKNFKTLDKNRDSKPSREEIDRGLRLARMFGIKPLKSPASYRDDAASKGQAPPK